MNTITAGQIQRRHLGYPVKAEITVPGEGQTKIAGKLAWFTHTADSAVLAINDEHDEATEWEFRLTAPITIEIGYQEGFRR